MTTDALHLGVPGRPPALILLAVSREDGTLVAEAHIVRYDLPAGPLTVATTGEIVHVPALRRGIHLHPSLSLEIP